MKEFMIVLVEIPSDEHLYRDEDSTSEHEKTTMSHSLTLLSRSVLLTFSSALAMACMLTGCDEPLDDEELAALEAEEAADELTAEPDVTEVAAYQCNIDVVGGIHDCNPAIISPSNAGGGRWTATANMNSGNSYRRMDVFAQVCNPTGWWLHLGDSPTNDGWGGDSSTTDHDAEAHILDDEFFFYSAYDHLRSKTIQSEVSRDSVAGGCRTVQMTSYHAVGSNDSTVRFDGGLGRIDVTSIAGLRLGYAACGAANSTQRSIECDWENAGLNQQYNWHVGINRMLTNAARVGSGVQQVCIRLTTDVASEPTSCIAPVAVPPPPAGGGGGGGGCLLPGC